MTRVSYLSCSRLTEFYAFRSYLIAYGQDNGELGVLEWRPMDGDPSSFTKLIELNRNAAFSSTVNRIR